MAGFSKLIYPFLLVILLACSEDEDRTATPVRNTNKWIIDSTEVIGEFSNVFPLVHNPGYEKLSEDNSLNNHDRALIIKFDNQVYVYPIARMWVEVVNDVLNDTPIVISYCPITESGIAWNRIIDKDTLIFRASGMLYKENLMPADTGRNSVWSQMLIGSVYGDYLFDIPKTYQLMETTIQTAKLLDKNALVMLEQNKKSSVSGRTYLSSSPQSNYFGVLEPSFAVKPELSVKLFKLSDFKDDETLLSYRNYLIYGNKKHNIITAFIKESGREFELLENHFPNILKDNLGSNYDVFGTVTSGLNEGGRLKSPPSYLAQLWAWESFFDNTTFVNE